MTTTRTRTSARRTALAATVALAGFGGLALPAASNAACPSGGDPEIANCPNPGPPTTKAKGTVSVNPSTTLGVRYVPIQRSKQFRQLRNGATVRIICQVRGSKVSGTFGTTRLWNKIQGGGYVSDAYINTGSDRRVAPNC